MSNKLKKRRTIQQLFLVGTASSMLLLYGCSNAHTEIATLPENTAEVVEETKETQVVNGIVQLTPEGPVHNYIAGQVLPEVEPAPEYLRIGVKHVKVGELQARLMELGFMDNDEPTDYYGTVTETAVKTFQRQNELPQDGIVGSATWDAIMNPDTKYYAVCKGVEGDDILRIQQRLYELGYLASDSMVTGNFGDSTETAVKKLQEVNSLEQDGKVGRKTLNLLYSEEIKPNLLAYGEKSEVVLAAQNRLKELGYMVSTPDGSYGNDTILAVKQFQSRNDQIVDGYLGPSTRIALMSADARPNGIVLGEQGDAVLKVQQLLSKYGYLNSANATGYFGDVTEKAVKAFQTQNSLSADGSVGAMTMAKLTSGDAKKAPAPTPKQTESPKPANTGNNTTNSNNSGNSKNNSSAPASQPASQPSGNYSGSVGALLSVASSKLGSPYVWGAKGPSSFDCSGFVYWCLNQVGVRQSYMTSSGWRNAGRYTRINSFSSLQAGDIVVVSGHVGIVAGGGTVIDASSSNGRVVHRALSGWWANNFICGWRIF